MCIIIYNYFYRVLSNKIPEKCKILERYNLNYNYFQLQDKKLIISIIILLNITNISLILEFMNVINLICKTYNIFMTQFL